MRKEPIALVFLFFFTEEFEKLFQRKFYWSCTNLSKPAFYCLIFWKQKIFYMETETNWCIIDMSQKMWAQSTTCHMKFKKNLSLKIGIWEIWQEHTWVVEKFQGMPSLHYKVGRNSEQAKEVKVIAWSTNGQNIRKLISFLSNLIFGDRHVQTT